MKDQKIVTLLHNKEVPFLLSEYLKDWKIVAMSSSSSHYNDTNVITFLLEKK